MLERRVDETVVERARQVMEGTGRVGEHLRKAWEAVYGRQPNPSEGYREAVRAVEAAAIPIFTPNDTQATLGRILRQAKSDPTKWKMTLSPTGGVDPINVVIEMMTLIWKAQLDRHGTPDDTAPISCALEEAEAALHIALTLTQWFTSGAVARV